MNYLWDTDTCIYFLNGNEGIARKAVDVLIASFALAYDLKLVTNNVSHFKRIPDLETESWLEP